MQQRGWVEEVKLSPGWDSLIPWCDLGEILDANQEMLFMWLTKIPFVVGVGAIALLAVTRWLVN